VRAILKVFDILGDEVATLVDEDKEPGIYEVEFSAKGGSASGGNAIGHSVNGRDLASGIYIYRLQTAEFTSTKKMVMLQ